MGLLFTDMNPFLLEISFVDCNLELASFANLKLKKTTFKNTNLQQVDFTQTDLQGSTFDNCNLQNAIFEQTNLEQTDFTNAINFSVNPEKNLMKKARFSRNNIEGLLEKYKIIIS